MAQLKWFTFEEGAAGNTPTVAGDYVATLGTIVYNAAAAAHGALGLRETNGGFLTVECGAGVQAFQIYFKVRAVTTGSPRIITAIDNANTFIGMIRAHTSGVFDLCDASTTRVVASSYTWIVDTLYRAEATVTGTGLTRTWRVQIFVGENTTPVWDSLAQSVTSATSNAWTRARVGGQGGTAGQIDVDDARFFDNAAFPGPIVPTVLGTAAASSALSGTAVGQRTVLGSAATSAGMAGTALGSRTVRAVAAASSSLAAAATGARMVLGQASLSVVFAALASGRRPAAGLPGQVSGDGGSLPGSFTRETIELRGTIR